MCTLGRYISCGCPLPCHSSEIAPQGLLGIKFHLPAVFPIVSLCAHRVGDLERHLVVWDTEYGTLGRGRCCQAVLHLSPDGVSGSVGRHCAGRAVYAGPSESSDIWDTPPPRPGHLLLLLYFGVPPAGCAGNQTQYGANLSADHEKCIPTEMGHPVFSQKKRGTIPPFGPIGWPYFGVTEDTSFSLPCMHVF